MTPTARSGSREDRGSRRFAQGNFAMIGPWPRIGAGNRGGRRIAAVALLLILVAAPQHAVRADDDPFSATVTVDATSDTVAKARDLARIDGQRRALTTVVERLTGGP